MSEKQSFWSTLPGIIAGLAAILTGGATILAFVLGSQDGTPAPEESPEPDTTASPGGRTSRPLGPGGTNGATPQAVIAPRTIDFGRVATGRDDQHTVTVANSGTEFLVVNETNITGRADAFSVNSSDCLVATGIEPQRECEIVVTFRPPSSGSFAAILQIEHSGPTSPSQVALSGEGGLLGL